MTFALILSVIAAVVYAATNHVDKYLVSKVVKNADYRSLVLISSLIAGGMMAIIYLFVCGFSVEFDFAGIAVLFANSVLYIMALIFYYESLSRDDTTIVIIMEQLLPVFVLILSPLFLPNQSIAPVQLAGGMITTLAAVLVTYEPNKKKFNRHQLVTLALMAATSILSALWFIIERRVNLDHDFNQTTFWSNLTLFAVGMIILVFVPSYRSALQKILKTSGAKVVGLNLANELLNSFSMVLTTFAGTLAPVALTLFAVQGVQPFAVMAIGALLTRFLPKIGKENVTKKVVVMRLVVMVLCLVGLACIEFGG